jgi:hypothetical protein
VLVVQAQHLRNHLALMELILYFLLSPRQVAVAAVLVEFKEETAAQAVELAVMVQLVFLALELQRKVLTEELLLIALTTAAAAVEALAQLVVMVHQVQAATAEMVEQQVFLVHQ